MVKIGLTEILGLANCITWQCNFRYGLQWHVRLVLSAGTAHDHSSDLWVFNRNPRSRAVVQRSGPVPYCLLLRHVVMHHLQRSPCRLQENGAGISVNARTDDIFQEKKLICLGKDFSMSIYHRWMCAPGRKYTCF